MNLHFKHILGVVLILALLQSSQAQTNSSDTPPQIYGVRWFLGEHYQFTIKENDQNADYFIVMFNSDEEIFGDLDVLIANTRFTCSTKFISTEAVTDHHQEFNTNATKKGDILQTFIHKCIIGDIHKLTDSSTVKQINYSIVLGNLMITQSTNINVKGYDQITLFSGTFRIPQMEGTFSTIVIGDWGIITDIGQKKGYHHVMPCLQKRLLQDENIKMLLFTGDLAYDLQGELYYKMLKHIQVITSKIVFMVTPGNHDTLYHADTFQLFTYSFYSPQWKHYSNYFYSIQIGKLVFIAYTPQLQAYNFTHPDRLKKNLTTIFQKQLTKQIVQALKKSYFTTVFSHYPIYCSNINDDIGSCQKNEVRMKTYRQYFHNFDMKLYLSGHLHLYERTKPICFDDSIINNANNSYDMSCPIYVVQGAGGNNDYVQTKQEYPIKKYSASLVYNSGFGVLTFLNDPLKQLPNVSFKHYTSEQCSAKDQFTMFSKETTIISPNNTNGDPNLAGFTVSKLFLKLLIFGIGILAITIMGVYVKKRYNKKQTTTKSHDFVINQHIQMVEQHFEAPQSSNPNERPPVTECND